MKKRLLIVGLMVLCLLIGIFYIFMNNTNSVNPVTQRYYQELRRTMFARGYEPNFLVISTKRPFWFNKLLVQFNHAATRSQHVPGQAIDFLVFDVNGDGSSNDKDVDIVYRILDREIIGNKGGLGTYKGSGSFFNRQMVHIDCRGKSARWYE